MNSVEPVLLNFMTPLNSVGEVWAVLKSTASLSWVVRFLLRASTSTFLKRRKADFKPARNFVEWFWRVKIQLLRKSPILEQNVLSNDIRFCEKMQWSISVMLKYHVSILNRGFFFFSSSDFYDRKFSIYCAILSSLKDHCGMNTLMLRRWNVLFWLIIKVYFEISVHVKTALK